MVGDGEPGQARARRPARRARPAARRRRGTRSWCGSGARRTGWVPRSLRSLIGRLRGPVSIEHLFDVVRGPASAGPTSAGRIAAARVLPARHATRPIRPSVGSSRSARGPAARLGSLVLRPALARRPRPVRAAPEIRPRITGIAPLSQPGLRLPRRTGDSTPAPSSGSTTSSSRRSPSSGSASVDRRQPRQGWVGLQGVRRRRGRGGDQRRAPTGRAGRAHVPAVRLEGAITKMRAFLGSDSGPGPASSPGGRPDGRAAGRRREPRLRADPAADPLGSISPSSRASGRRCRPASRARRWSRRRRPRRRASADPQGARPARRPADGHDLRLPDRLPVTGAVAPLDNATRNVEDHIGPDPAVAPAESLLLGVPYYGYDWPVTSKVPQRDGPVATSEVRRSQARHVRERAAPSSRPTRRSKRQLRRARGQRLLHVLGQDAHTYRQVYFEDEHSLTAKYDYVADQRPRRDRHLDARQRPRAMRRALERPARRVLRTDPRGEGQRQGRDHHALESASCPPTFTSRPR